MLIIHVTRPTQSSHPPIDGHLFDGAPAVVVDEELQLVKVHVAARPPGVTRTVVVAETERVEPGFGAGAGIDESHPTGIRAGFRGGWMSGVG